MATAVLGGLSGFKRLVKLVARAFYSGECPPRDVDPDVEKEASKSRTTKVTSAEKLAPEIDVPARPV